MPPTLMPGPWLAAWYERFLMRSSTSRTVCSSMHLQGGYAVVTSHRLLWIDASATPSPGRSCHMPLDSIHSFQKRVQYSLNLMNPKVRVEVKLFVDRHFKVTNSKQHVVTALPTTPGTAHIVQPACGLLHISTVICWTTHISWVDSNASTE